MELEKRDFLAIFGLKQLNNTEYKSKETKISEKEFKKIEIRKTNNKPKFKFNSFICSFPITTVVQNSFLSNKFYKNSHQPNLTHNLSYENFCQTTNNASPILNQISTKKNTVSSIYIVYLFRI